MIPSLTYLVPSTSFMHQHQHRTKSKQKVAASLAPTAQSAVYSTTSARRSSSLALASSCARADPFVSLPTSSVSLSTSSVSLTPFASLSTCRNTLACVATQWLNRSGSVPAGRCVCVCVCVCAKGFADVCQEIVRRSTYKASNNGHTRRLDIHCAVHVHVSFRQGWQRVGAPKRLIARLHHHVPHEGLGERGGVVGVTVRGQHLYE